MKHITCSLRAPAIISFLLVLPFMLLDLMLNLANRLHALSLKHALDFAVLFGLLWLLPTAFLVILLPLVRNGRAGNNLMAHPPSLIVRAALLAFIALSWAGLLRDQLPCFLVYWLLATSSSISQATLCITSQLTRKD